jgi:hypothetical protein
MAIMAAKSKENIGGERRNGGGISVSSARRQHQLALMSASHHQHQWHDINNGINNGINGNGENENNGGERNENQRNGGINNESDDGVSWRENGRKRNGGWRNIKCWVRLKRVCRIA